MTDTLYRWVKREERGPDPTYDIRHFCRNSSNHQEGKFLRWNEIPVCYEWLEPIPSNTESLEEAKKACADFVAANDKCSMWEIFEQGMKFAGAGYSKGGEEKEGLDVDVNDMAAMYAHQNKKIVDGYYSTENDLEQAFLWAAEWQAAKSSRPSLDIVKELREANPWLGDAYHGEQSMHCIWSDCCDKLQELLNAPSQSPQTPIDREPEADQEKELWERIVEIKEDESPYMALLFIKENCHITRK